SQVVVFCPRELKGEVRWEALFVTPKCLIHATAAFRGVRSPSRIAPAAAVGSQQFAPVITSSLDEVSIFCCAAAFHIFHWASFGVAICFATGNAQPNANVPPLSLNRE